MIEQPKTPRDLDEQLACVKRELALRKIVYGKKVEAQTMTPMEARNEYDRMLSVLGSLEKYAEAEQAQGRLTRMFPFVQEMASKLIAVDPSTREWAIEKINAMQSAYDAVPLPAPQEELPLTANLETPAPKRKLPPML